MTNQARHALRLLMRCFYTATGFHVAILTAVVAHDGLTDGGGMLPNQRPALIVACLCWIVAIILDGITSEPNHHRKG